MITRIVHCALVIGHGLGVGLLAAVPAVAQGHVHGDAHPSVSPPASTRITMKALHAAGGVPPGWRFTVPPGDAAAGRRAFVEFKCYACHAVQGEQFPLKPGETPTAGPDLTGMGGHHPAAYLAESIMNPSAVLVEGPGYIGGDGRSIMPSYPDMTVGQLADLVAYLKSLSGPMSMHEESGRELEVGSYHVRLVYKKTEAGAHMHHAHASATPMAAAQDRLLVFLTDKTSGQAIPYAPVTAKIEVPGKPAQTVKLSPSMGRDGFHYAAATTLPADTTRVTLSIGPTAMQLDAGAPEDLKRAQTAVFDWK